MNALLDHLPAGSTIRGEIYDDPDVEYHSGDVMEIELDNGLMIDVGWDADFPETPFRIVVYREYFGDRLVDLRVRGSHQAIEEVHRLAWEYGKDARSISSHAEGTSYPDNLNIRLDRNSQEPKVPPEPIAHD